MDSRIKHRVWLSGLLVVVLGSASSASAQCSGQSGGSPSGSRSSMRMNNPSAYSGSPLVMSGYPSSSLTMPDYFRQAIAMQAQYNSIGVQMAAKQTAQQEAYEAVARPYRLANAQAKREAFEKRKAARLAAQKSDGRYVSTQSP